MTVVARWYGNGLADETTVTSSTVGPGDTAFNTVTSGASHVDTTGPRSPRIRVDQQASTAAQLYWTSTALGTLTNHAVRVYLEMSAYPSAGNPILQAYGSGNSALRWRLDVTSAGLLRLRDASNAIVATASTAMATGTVYRIEVVVSGTAAAVTVHRGDTEGTPLVALAGAVGGGADAVRFGNTNTSPTWPTFWLDDLAVSNVAAAIGPRIHLAAAAWTVPVQWSATPAVRRPAAAAWTVPVGWEATAVTSGGPLTASASWRVQVGMTIDTGTPPMSVLVDGAWRPCILYRLVGGTWQ
ncbi:hypothetical protein [Spirillospora sp. NBC_01491]|uniref:hypothetical protein n=1 Tax=Spirillospora sp. NBC_01491 TaxID=2976007 RepID=UPI002E33092C|nr:hypothetical protein [Spirillospora sp. NBC_01491]